VGLGRKVGIRWDLVGLIANESNLSGRGSADQDHQHSRRRVPEARVNDVIESLKGTMP
jgi:hypothetical protein